MIIYRVKVIFKDEFGEGIGVVRSFYMVIGEVFLLGEKLFFFFISKSEF